MEGLLSKSLTDDDDEWEDVTALFSEAASEMRTGEMVHLESFSLYSAMSAIELMQPKMDVGCGPVRNVREVELPDVLSDASVVRIMDELLACQATWLQAHTLPQTVFSCVYTQRMDEVARPELEAFIRVQLASMSLVRTIVTTELVADEEDFISYNFGFRLPALSEPTVAKVVKNAIEHLNSVPVPGNSAESKVRRQLAARLKFLQAFHAAVSALVAPKCRRVTHAEVYIELAATHLKMMQESWVDYPDEVILDTFDPTFNRYLLANTPPRTAPVLPREDAFAVFSTQIDELRALTVLKDSLLPVTWRLRPPKSSPSASPTRESGESKREAVLDQSTNNPGGSSNGNRQACYSFQCLLHSLCVFSATWDPSVLTRSILKRMLLPTLREPAAVFSVPDGALVDLLLADIGLQAGTSSAKLHQQATDLVPAAGNVMWSLLRNRGRQRRWLIRSLVEWDEAVLIFLQEPVVPADPSASSPAQPSESQGTGKPSPDAEPRPDTDTGSAERDKLESPQVDEQSTASRTRDMFAGKTPLQLFSHEVSVRMMTQHWLLGFECNLYGPSEFAPVFFYVGYVLTTGSNATAALADCGMEGAELHPCRYALYLFDQARLWLCRGMVSLLEALELGEQWNYSWRRRRRRWVPDTQSGALLVDNGVTTTTADDDDLAAFESEELWYDQRFGAMRQLHTGAQFVDYRMFLTLMSLQRDALMDRSRATDDAGDEVATRLSDATAGFRMARDALDRTKQVVQATKWLPLNDEIPALARVAITNSVLVSQLQKAHKKSQADGSETRAPTFNVSFAFKAHRHFPTVSVSPRGTTG